MEQPGQILLLNGPSSSGKSSIAAALLPLFDDPWFLVPVDAVNSMRSTVHRRALDDRALCEVLRRTRAGYHRTVAALASVGNHVVMDYPLSEPWRLADLLRVLEGYDVTLVDVVCAPAELERRERMRGDRPTGLAEKQHVFGHGHSDLTVDTTSSSADECAAAIADGLAEVRRPKAFDRLRASLD